MTPSAWAAGPIERASVSSNGVPGNKGSNHPSISANGQFVAFMSFATNLVTGDTNRAEDIFVHDRVAGTTERVSVNSAGVQGNFWCTTAVISANGRFVAFDSHATNLVRGDTNGWSDVFVHDRQTRRTERISVSTAGVQGNGNSGSTNRRLAISADGRFVAFESIASNLVPGNASVGPDIFLRDRLAGRTERVAIGPGGVSGNGGSFGVALSAGGRFVAFSSSANNLVAGDTNRTADIFVRDRQAGTTERISVGAGGTQSNGDSHGVTISADGRLVAFASEASNLVPGAAGGIYLRDRQLKRTEWVSVSVDGQPTGGGYPAISAGGRFVAFDSRATNLVPGDVNGRYDVFLRDRQLGRTERISVIPGAVPANGRGTAPFVGAGGRLVAFSSAATNLVSGGAIGGILVRIR